MNRRAVGDRAPRWRTHHWLRPRHGCAWPTNAGAEPGSDPAVSRHQPSSRMIQTANATTTPIATIRTASWRPR